MKVLERLALIEKIGRELQRRMTYGDIDTYLSAYGINCKDAVPSVNSKYVYVKELLGNASETIVLSIADELGIAYEHTTSPAKELSFWRPGSFRLFLSHLSSFKTQASGLQTALKKYGISAFVAHEDIEPSKEWQTEIETALQTMDGLAALLMPGFKESNWCDQEVGFAVARDVGIVPVRKGLDPYGFIAKYQGIQATGKTIGDVAEQIFYALVRSPKTRQKMLRALATQVGISTTTPEAEERLAILSSVEKVQQEILEDLKQQVLENSVLSTNKQFLSKLNKLLTQYGIEKLTTGSGSGGEEWDADIPF